MRFIHFVCDAILRLGLLMNGITGKYADDIIRHNRTGKLPEDDQ